jgi:hypothetical protein
MNRGLPAGTVLIVPSELLQSARLKMRTGLVDAGVSLPPGSVGRYIVSTCRIVMGAAEAANLCAACNAR